LFLLPKEGVCIHLAPKWLRRPSGFVRVPVLKDRQISYANQTLVCLYNDPGRIEPVQTGRHMGNFVKKCEPSGFVARYKRSDGTPQTLAEHLAGASRLVSRFAAKVGLSSLGELMGLLHDLGKYSNAFQSYIRSAEGKIEPEDEDYVDAVQIKGKIDHSTAGAQYVWERKGDSQIRQLASELLALCIASHHSGLIDCLSAVGDDVIGKRLAKSEDGAHYGEARGRMEGSLRSRVGESFPPRSLRGARGGRVASD
jgi:CRISPR-associated endonuclease Cas3-HD